MLQRVVHWRFLIWSMKSYKLTEPNKSGGSTGTGIKVSGAKYRLIMRRYLICI